VEQLSSLRTARIGIVENRIRMGARNPRNNQMTVLREYFLTRVNAQKPDVTWGTRQSEQLPTKDLCIILVVNTPT
jgi:hypothetical protein